jgi:Na+-driven multidrug efflux pump
MFTHIPRLLKLAGPMILSSSAITMMQIIDAIILSRHSSAAVAAMPMGLRISGELVAWTLFLVVVGRLGTVELAASSIAFRINGAGMPSPAYIQCLG